MKKIYAPLKKLHIKNFQSVQDTTLELGGLTVLVGPGDAGKSAILRALRAVFLNDGEDADIRHNTNRCEVELSFEDGMSLTWWKERGKGGCYRMGGQEFSKTGGAVPEPVAEYLGIGHIEVDSTTELLPQLSDQHDHPFILWETGSARSRILGKATRLDMVVTAQMACKKELTTHHREAERLGQELEEVTTQLAQFPDVKNLTHQLNEVEATRTLVVNAYTLVERAKELRDQLTEIRSRDLAIDIGAKRSILQRSIVLLDKAELLESIREARLDAEERYSTCAESHTRLEKVQLEYTAACEKAGICLVCGGLLSHEVCTKTK